MRQAYIITEEGRAVGLVEHLTSAEYDRLIDELESRGLCYIDIQPISLLPASHVG